MNTGRQFLVALAAAVSGALVPTSAHAAPPAETSYCFAKHFTGTPEAPAWAGTWAEADGGACPDHASGGTLTSRVTSAAPGEAGVVRITIVWEFVRADGRLLFETVQAGTLDPVTGNVALAGVVTKGAHRGSATADQGQPIDAVGGYEGVMTVSPGQLPQSRDGYQPAGGCTGARLPITATSYPAYLDTLFGPEWGPLAGTSFIAFSLTFDGNADGIVCVGMGTYWAKYPAYPNRFSLEDNKG
jgi:hypothetical protein